MSSPVTKKIAVDFEIKIKDALALDYVESKIQILNMFMHILFAYGTGTFLCSMYSIRKKKSYCNKRLLSALKT